MDIWIRDWDWVLGLGDWDLGLELEIVSGDWDLGLGFEIGDEDYNIWIRGLSIWHYDWGLELGIRIGIGEED